MVDVTSCAARKHQAWLENRTSSPSSSTQLPWGVVHIHRPCSAQGWTLRRAGPGAAGWTAPAARERCRAPAARADWRGLQGLPQPSQSRRHARSRWCFLRGVQRLRYGTAARHRAGFRCGCGRAVPRCCPSSGSMHAVARHPGFPARCPRNGLAQTREVFANGSCAVLRGFSGLPSVSPSFFLRHTLRRGFLWPRAWLNVMPRSPWHASVQRTRVSCPGVRQEFPMQPNECVGAVLPTQLPNLVVNVLLAIARDINGVTPRCKASRSPAVQLIFDPAVCRAR